MIRININYQDNYIKQITLKGHANYANYGNDIVCAAVSATYLCTINGIFSINDNSIEVLSKNDCQIINVLINNDTINKLLENMIRCLKSLEEKYPNNIKIK
jgi:uncharacterized protein YsxB (DUF464 family)